MSLTGAVAVIQRFGSALNLNPHLHMLLLDGVYAEDKCGKTRFYRIKVPSREQLNEIVHSISQRLARKLEREGLLERDTEQAYLPLDPLPLDHDEHGEGFLQQLQGHSRSMSKLTASCSRPSPTSL